MREMWAQFVRRSRTLRQDEDPRAGLQVSLNPLAIRGVLDGPGGVGIEMWIEGEAGDIPVEGTLEEVHREIDRAMAARCRAVAGEE